MKSLVALLDGLKIELQQLQLKLKQSYVDEGINLRQLAQHSPSQPPLNVKKERFLKKVKLVPSNTKRHTVAHTRQQSILSQKSNTLTLIFDSEEEEKIENVYFDNGKFT